MGCGEEPRRFSDLIRELVRNYFHLARIVSDTHLVLPVVRAALGRCKEVRGKLREYFSGDYGHVHRIFISIGICLRPTFELLARKSRWVSSPIEVLPAPPGYFGNPVCRAGYFDTLLTLFAIQTVSLLSSVGCLGCFRFDLKRKSGRTGLKCQPHTFDPFLETVKANQPKNFDRSKNDHLEAATLIAGAHFTASGTSSGHVEAASRARLGTSHQLPYLPTVPFSGQR